MCRKGRGREGRSPGPSALALRLEVRFSLGRSLREPGGLRVCVHNRSGMSGQGAEGPAGSGGQFWAGEEAKEG